MIRLDLDADRLRGVALAVRAADRELRRELGRVGQARARPAWQAAVAARSRTAQDARVYAGPQVTRGNPPELVAAQRSRALSGGLSPATDWPWVEFGSPGPHGRRGQLPRRNPDGRVAYAAVADVMPQVVSTWVGVVFDGYAGALDAEG